MKQIDATSANRFHGHDARNCASTLRYLLAALAIFLSLFQASVAAAEPAQGWAGIVPGSNDYTVTVAYSDPVEACHSYENSFVPRFGYQVYGLISANVYPDTWNPYTGLKAHCFDLGAAG